MRRHGQLGTGMRGQGPSSPRGWPGPLKQSGLVTALAKVPKYHICTKTLQHLWHNKCLRQYLYVWGSIFMSEARCFCRHTVVLCGRDTLYGLVHYCRVRCVWWTPFPDAGSTMGVTAALLSPRVQREGNVHQWGQRMDGRPLMSFIHVQRVCACSHNTILRRHLLPIFLIQGVCWCWRLGMSVKQ
jgi:hypothetical protein